MMRCVTVLGTFLNTVVLNSKQKHESGNNFQLPFHLSPLSVSHNVDEIVYINTVEIGHN
jgi:hypothetical protein